MKARNENIQWIVQGNLTSQDDLSGLKNGCRNNNIPFIEVKVIPFTSELPQFEILPCNIYYGSATFINLIYENEITRRGLFFNPETFSIENYIDKWGKHMLNYGALVTTFKELMNCGYEDQRLLFIRPNDDSKSFAGEVRRFV